MPIYRCNVPVLERESGWCGDPAVQSFCSAGTPTRPWSFCAAHKQRFWEWPWMLHETFPRPNEVVMVDELRVWPHAGPPFHEGSCHLTQREGDLGKLHTFAAKLGLKRAWFQEKSIEPHYDLTPNRRARALELGAVLVTAREQAVTRRTEWGSIFTRAGRW